MGESGKSVPARVDADGTFADNGELRQHRLVHGVLPVGNHDAQRARCREGGARAESPAGRNGPVHQDLHAPGPEAVAAPRTQHLARAPQPALEVVGPLVDGGINLDAAEGNVQLAGRKAIVLDVGDPDLVGAVVGRRSVGSRGDGKQAVGRDGHGQHAIQRVVDVLADDVHAAGAARHEVGLAAEALPEAGEEPSPSFRLLLHGGFGIDLGKRLDDRDEVGHGFW